MTYNILFTIPDSLSQDPTGAPLQVLNHSEHGGITIRKWQSHCPILQLTLAETAALIQVLNTHIENEKLIQEKCINRALSDLQQIKEDVDEAWYMLANVPTSVTTFLEGYRAEVIEIEED